MKARRVWGAMAVAIACVAAPAMADDLSGADAILCAAVQATGCAEDEECVIGTPSFWNIPSFIEVDLEGKLLSTTKTSGDYRTTPIRYLVREEGMIVLQGFEGGRAFSFVIEEETGSLSAAVARKGVTVGVFGACTPLQR